MPKWARVSFLKADVFGEEFLYMARKCLPSLTRTSLLHKQKRLGLASSATATSHDQHVWRASHASLFH